MKSIRREPVAAISSSRWTAYATAGAASAFACVPIAEGDIHYSGLINQSFNAPGPGASSQAYFQLDQPGNSLNPFHNRFNPPFSNFGGAAFFVYANSPAVGGFFASSGGGTHAYISKLSFGEAISAGPFLVNGTPMYPGAYGELGAGLGRPNDQWLAAGIGFVGFRFDNGKGPQYGWARINMDGAPLNSFTLVDYAWGDVGDGVSAGQVPEPGSLALLALGGAGLLASRRCRSKAIAA